MFGVNLAGAEFGPAHGEYGKDYIYPSGADLDYYHSKGVTLIRLPFTWEHMQPTLGGALDPVELARMIEFLDAAAARHIEVVLDLHNFGRYDGNTIGSSAVSVANFADFWGKLAGALGDHPAVWGLGLMNEPHDMGDARVWPAAAQAAADAIRAAGSHATLVVSGDGWSGTATWQTLNASLRVNDVLDKVVYEAHAYLDRAGTGVYGSYDAEGGYPGLGVDRVQPFIDWLNQNGLRGFIGEYAVPDDDPRWLPVMHNMLSVLAENDVPSTYWAGGPWWPADSLSIQPVQGIDRPQMDVLEPYLLDDGTVLPWDRVDGTAGNDQLVARPESSRLFGYGGDDVLTGSAGNDILWGGAGNDRLACRAGDDIAHGGSGNDIIGGHDGNDRLYGDDGDDKLYGDAGHDTLYGGRGNDVLDGGDGDDLLDGGDGNDLLVGGDGNDRLDGGTGDDVLEGGNGNDQLFGGAGNDILRGDAGDDTLDGGSGNDQLFGGAGSDRLLGGDGDDVLDGGGGNDVLYGGNGNDRLQGGDGDDLIYGEAGDDVLGGGIGNDRIGGGDGNDLIYGDAGDDILGGHAGDDRIYGGDGNDKLYGDVGNDLLYGGAGNDWIEGGAGDDRMWGDAGADTFAFAAGSGKDTIMDFDPTVDRLVLNGQRFTMHDTPEGLQLDLSGGGVVVIATIHASSFSTAWIVG
ncbi:cellulase family glycosylhydrolase [Rhodoplanes roseus]|nr:cellulase family glycosylhydrolase [Rhodoplanes roseus]